MSLGHLAGIAPEGFGHGSNRAACAGRSCRMAEMMLAELFRRRVFTPAATPQIEIPGPLRMPATADAVLAEPSIAL